MSVADTRERLLDAAERLFAERGIHGASLRDITAAADANLAAVNYHFGSKEELARAVIQRRIGPVNAERLRRLNQAEEQAGGAPLSVEIIARIFLEPAMQLFEDPGCLCLMGRLHQEPSEVLNVLIREDFREVVERFVAALRRSRSDLDLSEVLARGHFMVGALVHTLTHSHFLALFDPDFQQSGRPDRLLESLVRFVTAGLGAPAPRP